MYLYVCMQGFIQGGGGNSFGGGIFQVSPPPPPPQEFSQPRMFYVCACMPQNQSQSIYFSDPPSGGMLKHTLRVNSKLPPKLKILYETLVCMYVCMYVCVYVHVYVCTYHTVQFVFLLGDITISGSVTLTVDSDSGNGASPWFTLTCISTGGPATTVTWTRDSEMLTGSTVLNDAETAQYTHTLTVTGRLRGLYTCTVANDKPSEDSEQLYVRGMLTVIALCRCLLLMVPNISCKIL